MRREHSGQSRAGARFAFVVALAAAPLSAQPVHAEIPLTGTGIDLCAQAGFNAGWRGSTLVTGVAIGMAESACNPAAENDCCHGLWQIHEVHGYSYACMHDPQCNADTAYDLQTSQGWAGPWADTYGDGDHVQYLSAAQTAVDKVQGAATPGVVRASGAHWLFKLTNAQSGTGPQATQVTFGDPTLGDVPFVGDWDGNGTVTPGVARPDGTNFHWYFTNATSGTPLSSSQITSYGLTSDTPIIGDWDGDGDDSPGVARSDGTNWDWYMTDVVTGSAPSSSHSVGNYGLSSDKPFAGDWNGNHVDSPGVARSDGTNWDWYLTNALSGTSPSSNHSVGNYGLSSDKPFVGDWNGDHVSSPGVARSDGTNLDWYMTNATSGTGPPSHYSVGDYGVPSDTAVAGDWDYA